LHRQWYKWPDGKPAVPYDAEEWRLFTDESKLSLKAVLLRNGGVKPSTPVAHSVAKEESIIRQYVTLTTCY
jgi:hypothetical protein